MKDRMLAALAFYFFSAILIASAIMVIGSKNPVHSVLFLILAFFNAAGLFVLLGAEFLAMMLVAMIGAIVLTLRSRPGVRRQSIPAQNARTKAMAVDMIEIKPGQGA